MRSCSTRYGPTSPWTRQSSEDRLRCGGDFNRAWGSGTRGWEVQCQVPVPRRQCPTPQALVSDIQPEAKLRRTVLRVDIFQVLRWRAFFGADGPVRPVEDVED